MSDEEYNIEDSWPDYNQLIDEILERIEAIQKKKDEKLFNEVKKNYPYFFENVENLENIKIRADYDKKTHKMIPDSIEYKLIYYLEMPKEHSNTNLLQSLQDFLYSQQMPNGGKKSRKSKKSKKSRKTTKKSKKSRKRKTAKKSKKSKK